MTTSNELAVRWRPHIEAWECSGQSQAAYCREHDLVKSRFTYWKNKLRPVGSVNSATPKSGFVPVRVMDECAPGLKLQLPNGVSIQGIHGDNLQLAQQLASTWL